MLKERRRKTARSWRISNHKKKQTKKKHKSRRCWAGLMETGMTGKGQMLAFLVSVWNIRPDINVFAPIFAITFLNLLFWVMPNLHIIAIKNPHILSFSSSFIIPFLFEDHSQQYSVLPRGSLLSMLCGEHVGCWPGQPHAKQAPYEQYYHSGLFVC